MATMEKKCVPLLFAHLIAIEHCVFLASSLFLFTRKPNVSRDGGEVLLHFKWSSIWYAWIVATTSWKAKCTKGNIIIFHLFYTCDCSSMIISNGMLLSFSTVGCQVKWFSRTCARLCYTISMQLVYVIPPFPQMGWPCTLTSTEKSFKMARWSSVMSPRIWWRGPTSALPRTDRVFNLQTQPKSKLSVRRTVAW